MIDIHIRRQQGTGYPYEVWMNTKHVHEGVGATAKHAEEKAREWLREQGVDDSQALVVQSL